MILPRSLRGVLAERLAATAGRWPQELFGQADQPSLRQAIAERARAMPRVDPLTPDAGIEVAPQLPRTSGPDAGAPRADAIEGEILQPFNADGIRADVDEWFGKDHLASVLDDADVDQRARTLIEDGRDMFDRGETFEQQWAGQQMIEHGQALRTQRAPERPALNAPDGGAAGGGSREARRVLPLKIERTNEYAEVIRNPSRADISRLSGSRREGAAGAVLRYIEDDAGNVYVGPYTTLHAEMETVLDGQPVRSAGTITRNADGVIEFQQYSPGPPRGRAEKADAFLWPASPNEGQGRASLREALRDRQSRT